MYIIFKNIEYRDIVEIELKTEIRKPKEYW